MIGSRLSNSTTQYMRSCYEISMKEPVLSIVVLSFNTREFLQGCLESLKKVTGEVDFELVVVDNGSTDGSLEMLEDYQFPSTNYHTIENKKTSGLLQVIIRRARIARENMSCF